MHGEASHGDGTWLTFYLMDFCHAMRGTEIFQGNKKLNYRQFSINLLNAEFETVNKTKTMNGNENKKKTTEISVF